MERVTGYSRAVMCVYPDTIRPVQWTCFKSSTHSHRDLRILLIPGKRACSSPICTHLLKRRLLECSGQVFQKKKTPYYPVIHTIISNLPLEQIALYAFPVLWVGLLIIAIVKLNLDSVPTTILALIFNVTNVIGFTYA